VTLRPSEENSCKYFLNLIALYCSLWVWGRWSNWRQAGNDRISLSNRGSLVENFT